jgi:diacylglycerol kinase family enzyme
MKFIVIINQHAGTAQREEFSAKEIAAEFAAHGVSADMRVLEPAHIEAALREAIATRAEGVVIGGGDGTVRSAAALLAGTGLPLGVLPLGTLNHFAKDLGLPSAWRDTVKALAAGKIHEVDVAEVNGHVFVNNCSLGSYAEAVRRRDALRREQGHGKWFAMARASWDVLHHLRPLRLRVATDGVVQRFRSPLVAISNNRYTGPVLATSLRAHLDRGELWLYTAHVHRFSAALALLWQVLLRRRPEAADALDAKPARAITIESETNAPVPVAADGELLDVKCPLQFRIRPRALRVLAPPTAAAK